MTTITDREVRALRMAASGHVSGTLAEWPELAGAFRAMGWTVPATLVASAMRGLAKAALATGDVHTPDDVVVVLPDNGRGAGPEDAA